jgi:NAD(P)-dependent dehydrogenase (short-subunit alcohol dehydrogenase family)
LVIFRTHGRGTVETGNPRRDMSGWPLYGKVFLITGGARGIGAATARELARRGARLVLADLDTEALAATAASITPTPLTARVDVTNPAECEAAVELALSEHGRLDCVWANAGIASFAPVALSHPPAWQRTVEVNLIGAYNTVRAALEPVIAQRGYVAVTASAASFGHNPGMSAYAASKAGVEAMCNSLRIEVAHHGVEVASIHPIWIDTDMVREGDQSMRAFAVMRAAMRPPFARTQPVQRAVADIVAGFEARRRRICTPRYVLAAHALRPLLTTRLFEHDLLGAAPAIEATYRDEVGERGAAAASISERVAGQLRR